MKRLAGLILCAFFTRVAAATDLLAVYEDARQNDPQLRSADAIRQASRESRPQALAALLPQVAGTGAYTRDHNAGNQDDLQVTPAGQVYVSPLPYTAGTSQKQWALTLKQNLFSWQNWEILRASSSQVAQAEANYAAAEQDLIFRVAEAYFAVLASEDALDAQQTALRTIEQQLQQTQDRFEVGSSASTDVEESKAARDAAAASVIAAKQNLAITQFNLQEMTGQQYEFLSKPNIDMPLDMPEPIDAERWVALALDQNLSLLASRLAADIARDNVNVAMGGHLPTIDLVASRSYSNQNGNYVYDTVPLDDFGGRVNDRQISLQISVPIFSGGMTQSKVRQSQFIWISAKEQAVQAARAAERLARNAYLSVVSGIARVKALKQALASSQVALAATEAGYAVGTRTAVDVLNARRNLVQAQTDYSGSRYAFILSTTQLRLAVGNLDRAQLVRINGWLSVSARASR